MAKAKRSLSSEQARKIANKRWEEFTPPPLEQQTTSVRVSIRNGLLSEIETSGEDRSQLVNRLLEQWVSSRREKINPS